MPHLRLNTKFASPNPYFNFISALPSFLSAPSLPDEENAKELLNALAAQVRPVCKKHGFKVNSFEEYEHNAVFLGRNWNAGETIEIVLRRSDGSFHNIQQLIKVLCHELAHIKHMNHGPGFQQVNSQLCHEVTALRAQGYYGDGMYSSGSRLSDSVQMAGRGLGDSDSDLPEYMCGGAQERQRASTLRRGPRQRRSQTQKTKRRKAGSRITSKYAFGGSGQSLNADAVSPEEKKKGTGFRKSTQSIKERQARLEATERRLKSQKDSESASPTPNSNLLQDSDTDSDGFEETDDSRRKLLVDCGAGWKFDSAIKPESPRNPNDDDILNLISDEEDIGLVATGSATAGSSSHTRVIGQKNSVATAKNVVHGLADMVRNEVEQRKRENIGLVGGRKLGGGTSAARSRLLEPTRTFPMQPTEKAHKEADTTGSRPTTSSDLDNAGIEWTCSVCTCLNHDDYRLCQACTTRRGLNTYAP